MATALAAAAAIVILAFFAVMAVRLLRAQRDACVRTYRFALDRKSGLADGFAYAVDCISLRRTALDGSTATVHCGGDFGSSRVDGSADGLGGNDGSSGGGGSSGGAASGDAGASASGNDGSGGGGDGGRWRLFRRLRRQRLTRRPRVPRRGVTRRFRL